MIIRERNIGRWVKDGVRYMIRPDDAQQTEGEFLTEVATLGYVLDPLSLEDREQLRAINLLDRLKKKKRASIASIRYTEEISGTTVNGIPVNTDERTKSALMAGIMASIQDPSFVFYNWKMPDGTFIDADITNMNMFYDGIISYVGGLFAKERMLNTLIDDAETIEELEQVQW